MIKKPYFIARQHHISLTILQVHHTSSSHSSPKTRVVQFAWRLTYYNKHTWMPCLYLLSTQVFLFLQSICSETCISHISPYLVSADLKHILDGPVKTYVSSNLTQNSNSSLCFQKQFTSETSLSEFGRWMFIETGATADMLFVVEKSFERPQCTFQSP